jgi:hypothetical protein
MALISQTKTHALLQGTKHRGHDRMDWVPSGPAVLIVQSLVLNNV